MTGRLSTIFDQVADSYECYEQSAVATRINQLVIDRVQSHLPAAARIADIGCGPGTLAIELAQLGYRVTGYDVSERMLAVARSTAMKRGVELDFVMHDVFASELPGAPFDAIVATMGPLNYRADPSSALGHLRQSVRAGSPAWLALARGAALPRALLNPSVLSLSLVKKGPLRRRVSVGGHPLDLFLWDPIRFVESSASGWQLRYLNAVGIAPRLPPFLANPSESLPIVRNFGSVSFLELQATT